VFSIAAIFYEQKPHWCLPDRAREAVGMGKDPRPPHFQPAKAWFNAPIVALNYDLASICFTGRNPNLPRPENAQAGNFSGGAGRVSVAQGTGAIAEI